MYYAQLASDINERDYIVYNFGGTGYIVYQELDFKGINERWSYLRIRNIQEN